MHPTRHGRFPRPQPWAISGLICALACPPCASQGASGPDAWQFEFTPYLWATGVSADVDLGRFGTQNVDVGFSDIWSDLDFAAMGSFEARRGPWGGLVDAQYMKLSTSQASTTGLLGDVNTDINLQFLTFAGLYRIADRFLVVDIVGGARYVRAKTEVDAEAGTVFSGRVISDTEDWWDGFIGTRVQWPLNDRWSLLGYVDAGAGGSDLTVQAIAGADVRLSQGTTLKFGYRYIRYERDSARLQKVSLDGIYVGAGFAF